MESAIRQFEAHRSKALAGPAAAIIVQGLCKTVGRKSENP